MADSPGARFACIEILRSPAVQSINFVMGPYRITGAGYLKVAAALLTRRIGVDVNPGRLKPDEGASYHADTNEFVFRTAALMATIVQRMIVVHESTHAAVDIQGFRYDGTWSDNEAVAHVAGMLYMMKFSLLLEMNNSFDMSTTAEPWATAIRIASSITSGNTNVSAKDAIDLRAKIMHNSTYAKYGMTFGTLDMADGILKR